VDNASPELQPEFLRMQGLTNEELRAVAQSQAEPHQYERQAELLAKNEAALLTPEERQELIALRQAADHLMLRKAYAWSLLRWRGQRIPPLQEMPVPR
jgi:parvulin-like peptidyl-prolyl isomerase